MLNREKNSKMNTRHYTNEQDSTYCDLLKLAFVTNHTDYAADDLQQAIDTLKCLPDYIKGHQRLLPQLNAKAPTLGYF
jgi:hypothetical protein